MPKDELPFILPPDDPGEEPTSVVDFLSEDVDFYLSDATAVTQWIYAVVEREQSRISQLDFIFCSDNYLHRINVEYLNHDTLTDIITFPYADPPLIKGDIFISIDRIRDNANHLQIPFLEELYRVIIHGVLHLCGYGDKSPEQKKQMTQKEDEALQLFSGTS